MTTKGTSMGFQVSSVDHVYVVPSVGSLTPSSTMLVSQSVPLSITPTLLHATTYLTLIHHRRVDAAVEV